MRQYLSKLSYIKFFLVFLTSSLFFASSNLFAHLPAYEGERVRNDNHFTKNGFAEPVRGECDFTAVGSTDPKAGSANIYLGTDNTPPNFFCGFTSQDDWSFEFPVDIIEISRTPVPDPSSLGLELEEGYIPCFPDNPNPFQCPRQINNPMDGSVINLPGQCVDLGQPGDPSASDFPDLDYHCALLPGAPRPRESSVLFSTLTGPKDVDWGVYRYDPVYDEQPIVGASQVPACKENLTSFVTFAYAGPIDMVDARSGELLFEQLSKVGKLPREIKQKLPDGYGIRVKRPEVFYPTKNNPRKGYASGFAQNGWLLAPDSVIQCIDDFEACLADQTGELSRHYKNNDIFFVKEDEPVDLYLIWWIDSKPGHHWWHPNKSKGSSKLTDVSITTGVVDQFIIGDFINISNSGPFSANGRYVHGQCTDPRRGGRADVTIETN
jgi:hypothetical protein